MKYFLFWAMACCMAVASPAQLSVHHLRCEGLHNPLGIGVQQPLLSWQLQSPQRGVLQTAYEILVGTALPIEGKARVWGPGKVNAEQSVHIAYAGPALQSGKRYYWQVRVWDNHGNVSDWSEPAHWQMGLLQPKDWLAKWIGQTSEDSVERPGPMLRQEFSLKGHITSATLYITAHGMYEAWINGVRVGEAFFTPGWTSYNKRLQYQAYDVTHHVKAGSNAIGALLANGWYRGNLAWGGQKNLYGKQLGLLCQLSVQYQNGSTETVISDGDWRWTIGGLRSSEIYHGETIDARLEQQGWTNAGLREKGWQRVAVLKKEKNTLVATENEPIKKHETFKPQKVFVTPAGEQVLDFGQNLVGFVTVQASGKAGDSIVIDHAEVLDKNGNFYTDNLRAAKQRNVYILRGDGVESFEPHFSWQGFRYIRVKKYPGTINSNNFTAVALYSAMQPTGSFTTSNALINQLQHNIEWGQKGNFLDVPTDCPQRDERLGWTGDAQVFARTAAFNMNVYPFFVKWLKDVAADQLPNGSVPFVIPNVLGAGSAGSAGWADVATIVPWQMYVAYGDKRLLQQQYPSMKAWVNFMQGKSKKYLWNTGFHFGDWLFYRPADDNDGRAAVTDKYLIAQAFFAHSTQMLLNAANVLGYQHDVQQYTELLNNIKNAFVHEYVTDNGRLVSSTQTAYVLALHFNLLPQNLRPVVAQRLAENIASYDNHLTTGFLGTPHLCHVLSQNGYDSIAFKLLLQDTYPSWLYPVKMGATTIWERWDGQKPDGTFQTPNMNSFNHYAYGAIGDWMYSYVGGLQSDEAHPGYKHSIIHPHTHPAFDFVQTTLQTPYGKLASHWKTGDDGTFWLEAEVPANTTATVILPAGSPSTVQVDGKPLPNGGEQPGWTVQQGKIAVALGSGKFVFTVTPEAR